MEYDDGNTYYGLTFTFREVPEEYAGCVALCNTMQTYKRDMQFIAYPEYGSKNHRFHFHMLVQVSNEDVCLVSKLINSWRRKHGRCDATRPLGPDGLQKTYEYISKDRAKMDRALKGLVIPITHNNNWAVRKHCLRVGSNRVTAKDPEEDIHGIWKYISKM